MQIPNKCRCGSRDVVYVVQKGRGKKIEMFCEKCLPVEETDDRKDQEDMLMEHEGMPC